MPITVSENYKEILEDLGIIRFLQDIQNEFDLRFIEEPTELFTGLQVGRKINGQILSRIRISVKNINNNYPSVIIFVDHCLLNVVTIENIKEESIFSFRMLASKHGNRWVGHNQPSFQRKLEMTIKNEKVTVINKIAIRGKKPLMLAIIDD